MRKEQLKHHIVGDTPDEGDDLVVSGLVHLIELANLFFGRDLVHEVFEPGGLRTVGAVPGHVTRPVIVFQTVAPAIPNVHGTAARRRAAVG